jgi:flavin reductase (DIM6/NTAB) family NADH-FMN oxidoreductase RutF
MRASTPDTSTTVLPHFLTTFDPSGEDDAQAEADTVAAFREAMARFPATVTVVTTGRGEGRRGFTATAVFSVSMAPPLVGVCINKSAEAHDLVAANRCFSVNVLTDDQETVANRFAARDGSKGAVRFESDRWETLPTGSPCLASAAANIDCELVSGLDVGTHTLVLGKVKAVRLNEREEPLMYFDRRFARAAIIARRDVPIAVAPIDGW